ncbi:uncharacterized protein PSFLO_00434 [Pseudozyma flocculosa]|uniref:Uncharacterized protein n=1 Tax=Pseudozyma flocculosa TaxID=84751 RepID=A0A5C3ERM2_9BASI|nr:uncharacterized protein PSFLO_00434 [Pseudozyma flocculosa]
MNVILAPHFSLSGRDGMVLSLNGVHVFRLHQPAWLITGWTNASGSGSTDTASSTSTSPEAGAAETPTEFFRPSQPPASSCQTMMMHNPSTASATARISFPFLGLRSSHSTQFSFQPSPRTAMAMTGVDTSLVFVFPAYPRLSRFISASVISLVVAVLWQLGWPQSVAARLLRLYSTLKFPTFRFKSSLFRLLLGFSAETDLLYF